MLRLTEMELESAHLEKNSIAHVLNSSLTSQALQNDGP